MRVVSRCRGHCQFDEGTMAVMRMLALALVVPLLAQGSQVDSWAGTRAIPSGTEVRIGLPDGNRIRDRFESASRDAIILQRKGRIVRTVQRPSVVRVQVRIPPSDRKTAWIATGSTAVGMLAVFPYAAPGTADAYSRETAG